MTDPYEDELRRETRRLLFEADVRKIAHTPPMQQLSAIWNRLQRTADPQIPYHPSRVWSAEDDRMRQLNPTKTQKVAQFAREHPTAAKRFKLGLAGLALGGLAGSGLWKLIKTLRARSK